MNQWDDPDQDEVVTTRDLYEVLGIERDATDSQIKRAYHKLAMIHHPDKRASNPQGSDELFKEIGYAYKVLSDPEKRQIYDMGGAQALEEQEGLANLNIDHLLLNILMWESGQKICFLCILFLMLLEFTILPLLVALQLDEVLGWSWFGVTTPLWIPLGLSVPIFLLAPMAIWKQYSQGKEDQAVAMQARASCVGCVVAGILLGCLAGTAWMLCYKADGGTGFTYFQSIIPVLVLEGLLGLGFIGMPRQMVLEGFVWKVLRIATLVMLAYKLDGTYDLTWWSVLSPLFVWCAISLMMMAKDVYDHRVLKHKAKAKDVTLEEEASRYAPFFFGLRATFIGGILLTLLLVSFKLDDVFEISFTMAAVPLLVSMIAGYIMICWAMLCFKPAGLSGEYEQFHSSEDQYGTFNDKAYP